VHRDFAKRDKAKRALDDAGADYAAAQREYIKKISEEESWFEFDTWSQPRTLMGRSAR